MKKDIIDELITHELNRFDDIVEVLQNMKLIGDSCLSESAAWRWFENEPKTEEKKNVLTALGYDVSKL